MMNGEPNIKIPVDLTNPGQFFACCGLLELADRIWPGAEGWFEGNVFCIATDRGSFISLLRWIVQSEVANTMNAVQRARLEELGSIKKKDRDETLEQEKKGLESLRRELPIIFKNEFEFRVDWFCDDYAGGSRFKTWAGQQSVIDIAKAMHRGAYASNIQSEGALWRSARGVGLPFNFDSDLGAQGSALDVGFSFDPLAASEATRIEGTCKPALELLAFIGLQRFRPHEITGQNRFVYVAWPAPLAPSAAACAAGRAISIKRAPAYEFPLLYRTKYLKSFLPATIYHGE